MRRYQYRRESVMPHANPECPHPERYQSDDGMATELVISEMIGGLVRGLMPDVVVETGTYTGQTTLRISEALRLNGFGHLWTVESEPELAEAATRRFPSPPHPVTVINADSRRWAGPNNPIDFLFIDSGTETRVSDIGVYMPKVKPGGIIVVHDHAMPKHAPQREWFQQNNNVTVQGFEWPSPRGLLICRKL